MVRSGRLIVHAPAQLSAPQRARLMDTLISSYAHLMLVDGVFQADPHPGNLLLTQRPVVQPTVAAVLSSDNKQQQQTVAATTGSEGVVRNARIENVGTCQSCMVSK